MSELTRDVPTLGNISHAGENPPVFQKAYEQFPEDVVVTLNYANALLKYGKKADGALRVLSDVRNDSRALFPMAVAYHIKGDWRKAEELLKEAYKQGDDRARLSMAKTL